MKQKILGDPRSDKPKPQVSKGVTGTPKIPRDAGINTYKPPAKLKGPK